MYRIFEKNGIPVWSPKVRTFWENDPNKNCSGHERLSFGDLDFELDLEIDLDTDSTS